MKTTGLNFIEAVKAANRTGCKIKLSGWPPEAHLHFDSYGDCGRLLTANGIYFQPTREAYCSEDWEVIQPESPKTMSFMEAVEQMKQGKSVRRLIYREEIGIGLDEYGIFRVRKKGFSQYDRWTFDLPCMEATDWIVVEAD